jgi:predicted enzyme related to lactoylglutathione lyase
MKHSAALLGALLICAAPAVAQKAELPPLVSPASTEHHVGKVIWADLATPDLAAAKAFYSGLFGWTFRDIHFGKAEYAVASLDGRPVGGLVQRAAPSAELRQPAWLTFIAVRDVDAVKKTALEHGAMLVAEPRSYARRGRQAIFSDPEGAKFAILASSSGDPSDTLAGPGDWIWSSLLVRDADKEAAFYQTLFGYDVFDLPSDDGLDHMILSTDEYARAGVNTLHRDSSRRLPHWLNFVRVGDATDLSARAVALGGRVLVEPHVDRHGSKLAVVADPAGAPIGLMEWTDADTKREPK